MGNIREKYCPICFNKFFIRSEYGTILNLHIQQNGFKKEDYLYKAEELLLIANAPLEILMATRRALAKGFVTKKCAVHKTLQAIEADRHCFSCGYQSEEKHHMGQRKVFFFRQFFSKKKQELS